MLTEALVYAAAAGEQITRMADAVGAAGYTDHHQPQSCCQSRHRQDDTTVGHA